MAETNLTNHLSESNGMVTMSLARKEAARQAAFEIEILSITLRRSIDQGDGLDLIVRGISKRMEEMAQVAMCAIGDESSDVEELFSAIGCDMPKARETEPAIA